jgi:hypothetical protein
MRLAIEVTRYFVIAVTGSIQGDNKDAVRQKKDSYRAIPYLRLSGEDKSDGSVGST